MTLFLIHTGFKYLLLIITPDYNTFNKIQGCFSLLYGPYLYFYLSSILGKPVENKAKRYHLVPFLIAFILNIKILSDTLVFKDVSHLDGFHTIMVTLVLLSLSGYAIFILLKLKTLVSTDDQILSYKLKIVRVIALFLLVPATAFTMNFTHKFPFFSDRLIWYTAMIVMMAMVLNYRFKISGISRTEKEETSKTDSKKYYSSSLSENKMEEIVHNVIEIMNSKKPFLDPDFSLEDLSEITSIPKHHITEGLNASLHVNFYRFINQFRVEESKRLIGEMNPDQNLIEIGFASGFKSKSTFNKYFKEISGNSPSEYLKTRNEVVTNNTTVSNSFS